MPVARPVVFQFQVEDAEYGCVTDQEVPSNSQNWYSTVPLPPVGVPVNVTVTPGDCGLAGLADKLTAVTGDPAVPRTNE